MKLLTATIRVTGLSPYSPSAPLPDELTGKDRNETHDQHETRVWRERIWKNDAGEVFQPAAAYKKALDQAASLTKRKVKGAGNQTYAQHMAAGLMLLDDVPIFKPQTPAEIKAGKPGIPIMAAAVPGRPIFVSPDGDRRGTGKRVFRTYGMIKEWEAVFRLHVVNGSLTPEIIETYLTEAGMLVGIGRYRPINGGSNGRFLVSSCQWSNETMGAKPAGG